MLFDLTEDQALLRDTSVRFVEGELPLRADQASCTTTRSASTAAWLAKSAELGWFAMLVPEEGRRCVSGTARRRGARRRRARPLASSPARSCPMNVVASALAAHGLAAAQGRGAAGHRRW